MGDLDGPFKLHIPAALPDLVMAGVMVMRLLHNEKSYAGDDVVKDLTEEDFLYFIGMSYGITDGNDQSEESRSIDLADYIDHASNIREAS
jgi:hypothetical protein